MDVCSQSPAEYVDDAHSVSHVPSVVMQYSQYAMPLPVSENGVVSVKLLDTKVPVAKFDGAAAPTVGTSASHVPAIAADSVAYPSLSYARIARVSPEPSAHAMDVCEQLPPEYVDDAHSVSHVPSVVMQYSQ